MREVNYSCDMCQSKKVSYGFTFIDQTTSSGDVDYDIEITSIEDYFNAHKNHACGKVCLFKFISERMN